jgi:hypothetical protein
MSLVDLYNQAEKGTYVGEVKTKQATDVGAKDGVNFMDGTRRRNPEPDEYQTEFKRNAEGTYAVGGAQGTVSPTNNKTYELSRWTPKSLKLAFEQEGPASLSNGFYNNRFRTATTAKGTQIVHNYTPLNNKGYVNLNSFAAARVNSSATSF